MTKDISRGSNDVGSVLAILDRYTEINPDHSSAIDATRTQIRGRVELKKVFFAYPSRPDQLIFRGLSLKISAGTTVALVGQSGCGKSTIIGLIERFYDPDKGSVYIDEKDIKDYNLRSLRKSIALVSQEPTLFAETIYENIAYGKENAKESEIIKAAVLANAHEFLSGMNDGYETQCGQRGVQLSGGQKQRIAIARAILKNPKILLLDEATSALDTVSESAVQEALEKMMVGRTCIVVAHRLSTTQKATSIAVIKDGAVAEQGSHSDLLSIGKYGTYYSHSKERVIELPWKKEAERENVAKNVPNIQGNTGPRQSIPSTNWLVEQIAKINLQIAEVDTARDALVQARDYFLLLLSSQKRGDDSIHGEQREEGEGTSREVVVVEEVVDAAMKREEAVGRKVLLKRLRLKAEAEAAIQRAEVEAEAAR
ncbi:hypothetical protein RND71_037641 [Anisodus tanguticus]|uniref:ABC transporter domain-containing protein n=1 Tax=Anisodus tanguticus TaxID=243964 RepID=A0AAE1QY64_9SOLA|nr:hypothetical protein RND71_037641 [Anisodus tanguticus]